jgi:hypothetical protein
VIRLAVSCWAFFGVVLAIVGFVKGQGWPTTLATGFLAGGALAVLVVLLVHYQRSGWSVEHDEVQLSEPQRRAASRAVTRGAVPHDPDVRRAALREAVHRLEQLSRHAVLVVALLVGMFLLEVVLALMVSPLHWLGAALAALALVARFGAQTRLHRRVELLNPANAGPAASAETVEDG